MKVVISKSGKAAKPFLERIELIQGDITHQKVGAIAILVPQTLEFSGSINKSVCDACGHDLDGFILENIYKPKIGEVYALPGFDLPARHILVGIMPRIRTEFDMQDMHLISITRKIMELARCMLLPSIAFPPLASGAHGYPKARAARLVANGITDRLEESFEEVKIVCPDAQMIEKFSRKLEAIGWGK